jgi:hypothetical protein
VIGVAAFSSEPLLKLKMASVAEWDARHKDREKTPILKNGEVVMDVVRGGVRKAKWGTAGNQPKNMLDVRRIFHLIKKTLGRPHPPRRLVVESLRNLK